MQKDTYFAVPKIPIPRDTHKTRKLTFSATENKQKPILFNRKPLRKRKIEKNVSKISTTNSKISKWHR